MDDKVASYILSGIASAGIIATIVCVARIHNLKQDLQLKEIEVSIWKRSYVHALSSMTLPQIMTEINASYDIVKFNNIIKDI